MTKVNSKIEVRPLYEIASEIKSNWVSWRKSYAEPYISAMSDLSSIDDNYMFDSAKSIVCTSSPTLNRGVVRWLAGLRLN